MGPAGEPFHPRLPALHDCLLRKPPEIANLGAARV
jgi:hypothetical protein